MKFAKRLFIALLNLLLGIVVGLFLLEIVLRANPKLLLRGMSVPAPVDTSLITQTYDVHYSDADVFYWRPDLIHPIAPEENLIEARVHYVTDELGFRNQPPTPPWVDFVVLGSSFSVGAQVETSWPELLAGKNEWKFLNLAQPASTLDIQLYYLEKYARPHQPRWVVIEIMPMLSILGYAPQPPLLIQQLTSPFIQQLARQAGTWPPQWKPGTDVYPLPVKIAGRDINLVCCLHLMNFLTLDAPTLIQSTDWQRFEQNLLKIVNEAKAEGACVAIVHAPNKPVVYFPLVDDPTSLEPVLATVESLQANAEGRLIPNSNLSADIELLLANIYAGNMVLLEFAIEHELVFVDPTTAFQAAILNGQEPYMVYDSHLNTLGHQILADLINEQIQSSECSH